MNDGEEALVIRSRRGDDSAFAQLVHGTARGVFSRLYLETADAHRAEDLVQETFLQAWKNIGALEDPKRFRGWLYAIARRVLLDSVKHETRKKRGNPISTDPASLSVADVAMRPDELAEQSEQRKRAIEMLNALPPEYRDVLALRYLGGADFETIRRQLSLSDGALRGLLSRGMKLLRERMTPMTRSL